MTTRWIKSPDYPVARVKASKAQWALLHHRLLPLVLVMAWLIIYWLWPALP